MVINWEVKNKKEFIFRVDSRSQMPKVLIISDTHENYELLEQVLMDNQDCEFLIHLGDEPTDLDVFDDLIDKMQIFSVFGIYNPLWSKETACKSFTISDTHFVIAHTIHDLHVCQQSCGIYCFGHTHHQYFEIEDEKVLINPGHLKNEIDRGEIAGYAVMEMSEELHVSFFDFQKNLLEEHQIII